MFGDDEDFDPNDKTKLLARTYNENGYNTVTNIILNHLNTLITDADMDVRKAASDALATLALFIKPNDIASMILPIPLRLAHENHGMKGRGSSGGSATGTSASSSTLDNGNSNIPTKQNNEKEDHVNDDFHITATNLLGDIASLDSEQIPPSLVTQYITPTMLALCKHPSFRVRRAAVQALPRVVSGSSIEDIERKLIPSFQKLGEDEMYRVRKSVGECLVDMSRSLMLLPSSPLAKLSTKNNTNNNDGDDKNNDKESKYSTMDETQIMEVMMDMRRERGKVSKSWKD